MFARHRLGVIALLALAAAGIILAVWSVRTRPMLLSRTDRTVTKNGSIVSFEQRTDESVRITNAGQSSSVSDQNPCFVDDRAIVFTRFENGYNRGPSALVRLELATGKETVLIDDGEHDHVNSPGACFDRAMNRIAFASDRDSEFEEIYTANTGGSDIKRVTTQRVFEYRSLLEPSFSPNGQRIAFESSPSLNNRDEEAQPSQVDIVNVDGSNRVTVTSPAPSFEIRDQLPNWSRDGRLLFQRQRLERIIGEVAESAKGVAWQPWDIWVVEPVDGGWFGQPRNVSGGVAPDSNETDNTWFPSGRWIVTSSDYGRLEHPSLFAFPTDGGPPIRLTTDPDHEDGAPSVSPDGRWVVFESHRTAAETSPTDLWLVRVPTSVSGNTHP